MSAAAAGLGHSRGLRCLRALSVAAALAVAVGLVAPEGAAFAQTAAVPGQPARLRVYTVEGSLSVSAVWEDVAGADDYHVQWRAFGSDSALVDGGRVEESQAEITVDGYGVWVLRVRACNAAGCGRPESKRFTVTPPNRAPVIDTQAEHYSGFVEVQNAPRGIWVSKPFDGIFTDPEGDTLVYTVSVPDDRAALVDQVLIHPELPRVFFRAESGSNWGAVIPPLESPAITAVTLTATDPDGLSASVTGYMRTLWAPDTSTDLGLSLDGDHERITATWQAVTGAARYLVQWRSGDQSYDGSRQQEEPGGQLSPAATVEGLDNDTAYTVRVAALDGDGQELAAEEQTAQPVSASDYIEDTFIDPYTEDFPWLAEAWYGVPPAVKVVDGGACCTYYQPNSSPPTLRITYPHHRTAEYVYRILANHYLRSPQIHEDSPDGRLSILSLWLHMVDLRGRLLIPPEDDGAAAVEALVDYTLGGGDAEFADDQTLAIVAAANAGQIPQWYYRTYTNAGTVETTQLDTLWGALGEVDLRMGLFPHPEGARSVFGGFCSAREAQFMRHVSANPWVDGGCVNQKVRDLSLSATSAAGELKFYWFEPAYPGHPATDHYVIQWKSGDQDYDEARQAIIPNTGGWANHTITGLTAGTQYTIRVAPFNEADDSMFTNSDGHSRTREITATATGPMLNLSLEGIAEHVFVDWSPQMISPASYLVQWRSGDQSYDSSRQREVFGGSDDFTEIIGGLDNGTAYTVRVAALDDQGQELLAEEQPVQVATAHSYIEDQFIVPLMEANPWMQEAWFDVPVGIHLVDYEPGIGCAAYLLYDPDNPQLRFCSPFRPHRWPVLHELGHHYTILGTIHADDPIAKLSILSLWLHQTHNHNPNYPASESVVELLLRAGNLDYHGGKLGVGKVAAEVARAAQQQQIPQWYYDTYTSDGTLATTDLDALWADLRDAQRNGYFKWYAPKSVSAVFGGYCSWAEGTWALETAGARNAWVDGGCVNRRPQALSAVPGGAGELVVTWQAPLYLTTPEIDSYLVQWKTADQEYDTTRQRKITDRGDLSHIITGLTAGAEYSVRVAAFNHRGTADYADDDGHIRAAETAGSPGGEPAAPLGLSLQGNYERIVAEWQSVGAAASYRVQWARPGQSFSSDRQHDEAGGAESYSVDLEGLGFGVYIVRVAALDGQGDEVAVEQLAGRRLTHRQYIEKNFIVPYMDNHPWLAEAWFEAPVKIRIENYPGHGVGYYFPEQALIQFYNGNESRDRASVHKYLARHYLLHEDIHHDDPAAKLSMLSMWLHATPNRDLMPLGDVLISLEKSLASYTQVGDSATCVTRAVCETVASASRQQVPKWFYDTYTYNGTIETVSLDRLWTDLVNTTVGTGSMWADKLLIHGNDLFGGYCSWSEGTWALETAGARNPWADGRCVNRRPQALTAAAGGAGELVVSWQAPQYSTSPEIDAYVVQWKTGDQDYDTSRQAAVTDLDNLTHTIGGLTAGAEYTVRVAAVNQTDTSDFTDGDGRERTAETAGTAG